MQRVTEAINLLREINLGATAIGTTVTAAPGYPALATKYLSELTGTQFILAGDLIYVYENIEGDGSVIGVDTMYVPVGVAVGSQTNLVFATEDIMQAAGCDARRVIPVHERRLVDRFPSREREGGLRVSEICLADGEASRL